MLTIIEYITIATSGDASDFGDIVANSGSGMGVWLLLHHQLVVFLIGGGTSFTQVNEINYITIGTLGNSTDFGDLSAANRYYCQGLSSGTRGVVAGIHNLLHRLIEYIEFITIASTGDAQDFGDLVTA